MPDWAVAIITALIGGLSGAGGLAAYLRMRVDARQAAAARQDDYTLKLRDALDKDEAEFRKAVYEAYLAEVARNRDLDARLTTTQGQLTIITLERDSLRQKYEQALDRIRQLEGKVAELEAQNQKEHS